MKSVRCLRRWALLVFALLLSACGGGKTNSDGKVAASTEKVATVAATGSLMARSARLNSAELARAASAEGLEFGGVPIAQHKLASGLAKFSGGTRVPVYRFYVPSKGVHFYTASETEKQKVEVDLAATYQYEGVAFYVSSTAVTGLSPVHRYLNSATGTHFYTISADERSFVDSHLTTLRYEGVAFYASQTDGSGLLAVTRFFQTRAGSHFYTRNATEAQSVRDTLSAIYREEGTSFYAIDPSFVAPAAARLPHSGITAQQCFEAASDTLVACNTTGATALNGQQDGHRTAVNPMSYGQVPNPSGGHFALTECVKDNMTGLIWEGKEASGLRVSTNTYTNYDDTTQPQRYTGSSFVNPTQAELDAATNSVGYVNYVNSISLCGYTDWRMPTASELQSLVDYGVVSPEPAMVAAWFPNTRRIGHWSSSPYMGYVDYAWGVGIDSGYVIGFNRRYGYAVRLVRDGL